MPQFGEWSLSLNVVLFLIATSAILFAGTRLAKVADRLADLTGLGEAFFGALFLGGSTSLSGIVTSVTAAAGGHAELAVSNALGGIAAQTVFLSVADITYRKANLEHASASEANLVQGTLLITLLSIPLLTMTGPEVAFWGIHPTSVLLIITYILGLRLISKAHTYPMWVPEDTDPCRR